MPEGPELARSRDHLRGILCGAELTKFEAYGGRYAKRQPDGLRELRDVMERNTVVVGDVNVKGKFMWWTLRPDMTCETWYLFCTYGMSGMWTTIPLDKHTTAIASVRGIFSHATVQFHDPRHFGTLKFVRGKEALDRKLATLGPDMLNAPPNEEPFREALLRKGHKTLAEVLMDQSVVSGVGNYVKAEALYLARLSPHRRPDELITAEISRLRRAIIDVMKASYESGGATFATYFQGDGRPGQATSRFVVYGNRTDPLGNPVVREETKDGRTTHWVPAVQS